MKKPTQKPTPRKNTTTKPTLPRFHAKLLSGDSKEQWDFSGMPTSHLKISILGLLVHVASLYLSKGQEKTQRRTIIDRTFIVKSKLTPQPHIIITTKPARVRAKKAR